jgi:hypothetical protein
LNFISPDGAKKLREFEEESPIALENAEEDRDEDLLEAVKDLPSRRVLNSGPHDPYIEEKRAKANRPELKARTAEESDKPVILKRKIIIRDKK